MEPDYLGIKEIAKSLALKESHVYVLVESKQIPHYRINRFIRFKKEDVEAWMEANKQETVEMKPRSPRRLKKGPDRDIKGLVKKSIASVNEVVYTKHHGKPDRIEGLGKEVKDGAH